MPSGAITAPSVLPPVMRAANKGSVHPVSASCRSSLQVDDILSASEPDSTIFFEKMKCHDESSNQLEDQEAEAAASASAVAVAAISNDDVIESGLGASLVSASEKKCSGGEDVVVLPSGGKL